MAQMDRKNSAPPPLGDPRTLYVVDISGYVFRAYHALPPLNSPRGEPTHAVLGVTSMLLKLIAEKRPALLAVAMDSRTKSFRHELDPAYKANRPPAPPDLQQQMERVREVVEAHGIAIFQQEGMEADDIIASLVRQARGRDLSVVMVSADKDLLQLVGDRVFMLDSMRDKLYGRAETRAKLGVDPEQVRDLLALVGDSSDNVPGVPSVGPKTAMALLQAHGDLDGVYASLEQIARVKLRDKLREHREAAYRSRELVSLRDDLLLGFDPARLDSPTPDEARLIDIFKELGFTRLLAGLPANGETGEAEPGPAAPSRPRRRKPATADRPTRSAAELEQLARALGAAERIALITVTRGRRAVDTELLGLAFAWPDSSEGPNREIRAAVIEAGDGPLGGRTGEAKKSRFEQLLGDAALPKVCSDTKRAAIALSSRGIGLAGVAFDTTVASYLLGPERRAHALKDVARAVLDLDLTVQQRLVEGEAASGRQRELDLGARTGGEKRAKTPPETWEAAREMARASLECAKRMQPRLLESGCEQLMRETEVPLASILAEMEREGIRLNAAHLLRLSKTVEQQLAELEERCQKLAGRPFNLGSPRQLESILFDDLGLPVIRRTKTARSTDRDTLDELASLHGLPAAVLDHRALAKLKNTYLDTLPRQVDPRTGRIHTEFHQDVTATGRLSSSDPNLQNIPIRTPLGRSIRDAFIPREGWELLSADYSQIELRVLAHISGDAALVEAFGEGLDVHTRTASAVFEVPEGEITRDMRAQAKVVNYAVIYGQTQFALARSLRIDRLRAGRYIEAFFRRYAGVDAYLKQVVEEARQTGFVRTLYGRRRPLPELNSGNRNTRQQAERMARNTPIQGTAADIIKKAMVAVDREMKRQKLKSRLLLTVHDELVLEAPPGEKQQLAELVREGMEGAAELAVPLVVDLGWGASWGQAH
mgnify:CR=1 FL=1